MTEPRNADAAGRAAPISPDGPAAPVSKPGDVNGTALFENPDALIGHEGEKLGLSDWVTVDQNRIDGFAAVTGDHQWIHVDVERAKSSVFGGTIAHGYLTLALVNMFLPQIIEVRNVKMGVNIGCDNVRFLAPVRAGARIRGSGVLLKVERMRKAIQAVIRITVEIENETKPACIVDTISRYYGN